MTDFSLRVLGIVPARGGSKRVPRKNLRLLGGRPLVLRALEAARGARRLARVVVSSDDGEILDLVRGVDPALALPRPAELAEDTSPAIDYVRHALATLEAAGEARFDAVAILQPTSPFTLSADVDATLELLARSGASSAVSVVQVAHDVHPVKLKLLEGDRLRPYLEEERGRMAEHELPRVYVRNCAVYASRRELIEAGHLLADDCRAYVMPRERSLDVNDEMDFAFAEFLLSRGGP